MFMLHNFNLRQKIILIISIASTAVIIFASIMWGYYDSINLRKEMVEDLRITTNELGKGMRKAVEKDDRKKIIRDLSSLKDNPGITSAWVLNSSGKIISGYLNITEYTKANPDVLKREYVKEHMDIINESTKSALFLDKSLILKQAIIYEDKVVGYIYMFSTIERLEARAREHIQIVAGISFVSILLSIFLAYRMHRAISKPIVDLACIMDEVSRSKDYSIRVEVARQKDEVAELMVIFNEMISEIESATIVQQQNEEQIRKLAYFDALTKMPNRRLFHEYLQLVIRNSEQRAQPFALLFIDLNKFKQINDNLGHDIGDLLLQNVAKRIKSSINIHEETDHEEMSQSEIVGDPDRQLASRLGGDEFTIIIPNINEHNAVEIAERIIYNCKQPLTLGEHLLHPSISVGIAEFPTDANTESALLKAADLAMYHSKQQRKGSYAVYSEAIINKDNGEIEFVNELKQAIELNELIAVYAPIVNLSNNKIIGAQSIFNWQHPSRGLICADEFLADCDNDALLIQLGIAQIQEISRSIQILNEQGYYDIMLSTHITPSQIASQQFLNALTTELEASNINTSQMMIELNESVLLENIEKTKSNLTKIKGLGLRIGIGDFGTGYSSLRYLAMLPIDYLKIDGEFITNMLHDKNYSYLTKIMVDISKTFHLETIAGSIEIDDQIEFLKNLGCEYGEGRHFYRPMSFKDLLETIVPKHN